MAPRRSNTNLSPTVDIPPANADRPAWTKIAVLAGIGFVAGVAWPRLAGIRLGASVPEAATPSSSASPESSVTGAPAAGVPAMAMAPPLRASSSGPQALATTALAAPPPAPAPASASEAQGAPATGSQSAADSPGAPARGGDPSAVAVGRGSVVSCNSTDGEALKGADCGALSGLDALVSPRLRKLGSCPAARGAAGKLRLVLRLDFVHGTTGVELGHGRSSVPDAEALLACARSDLAGTPVASVTHDNARYAVAYPVTFTTAPFAESSAGAAPLAQAGGAASDAPAFVQWDAAIIRDAPRTGKVLARLPRGTTLRVGTVSDGWYPVKYGEKYASEGWVVRGAIGR